MIPALADIPGHRFPGGVGFPAVRTGLTWNTTDGTDPCAWLYIDGPGHRAEELDVQVYFRPRELRRLIGELRARLEAQEARP